MNNMKQWQQDISNVVDKNSLDIKNLQDNTEVGKLTVRINNIEAKDREQDVQLSNHSEQLGNHSEQLGNHSEQLGNHSEQLGNLFNKINTDVADTKTEINNTIEQLRLNTNNSITALQTSTDRALDTIKQNTTDSLNSLRTSIDRNIELLKSNTADSITTLQTSIDRHTEELNNCVRSVNGVNADEQGNAQLDGLVKSVNGATADASGNVTINTLTLKEEWHNSSSWYRVYSDGWCEQGGSGYSGTITLLKAFANTNYIVTTRMLYGGGSMSWDEYGGNTNKTTATFNVGRTPVNWYACGYIK